MQNQDNSAADYKRAYETQKEARKKAEHLLEEKSRELFRKNVSLEKALEKLVLQQSQLIAQEKLASVGQLGAGLAHELNNPNAFIQNNIQTLNEYVVQLSKGLETSLVLTKSLQNEITDPKLILKIDQDITQIKQQSDIDFIKEDLPSIIDESLKGTKRITGIANGLRYFANPDLSTRKPLNINECIQQAMLLIPNQLEHVSINFTPVTLPETSGLPILLSQALVNIMLNAIESHPKSNAITITTRADKEKLMICVEDDGIGIKQENLDKVIHPFFTTYNDHNGLGLGIANSIILQHQGTLDINSTLNEGTTVNITLPIVKE